MLELISDFRSGRRLELVLPVFNESRRIKKLIDYYRDDFDIVLLDGGSTDGTQAIAIEKSVTVYRRLGSSIFTEAYFAHYANQLSLSGKSFYFFADEHVDRIALNELVPLMVPGVAIIGRRIDWCYGQRIKWFNSYLPRGVVKGEIIYRPEDLHTGLAAKPGAAEYQIDIQHLQIWDMKKFLGQCAAYAAIEIEKFQSSKWPFLKFVKRFVVFELAGLPKRLWRQRRCSVAFQLWQVLIAFVVPIVALLCLLESRYLMTVDEQFKFYDTFYDDI